MSNELESRIASHLAELAGTGGTTSTIVSTTVDAIAEIVRRELKLASAMEPVDMGVPSKDATTERGPFTACRTCGVDFGRAYDKPIRCDSCCTAERLDNLHQEEIKKM
jgi:predicted Zn-ribbon and HTH transcriptional regulator